MRLTVDFAQQLLAVAHNIPRLYRWATSSKQGHEVALQRLAEVDRTRYASALVTLLRHNDGKTLYPLFTALIEADPEQALSLFPRLSAPARRDLAAAVLPLLHNAHKAPAEAALARDMIRTLGQTKNSTNDVIEALVPPSDPHRYPSHGLDDALLRLADAKGREAPSNDFADGSALLALARRGRSDLFDYFAPARGGVVKFDSEIDALALMASADPARLNPKFARIISANFTDTSHSVTDLIWAIWSSDLRQLRPELERLATDTPDQAESFRASRRGGEPSPVTERFHLARQILSLWDEPDSLVRAKMLIALALSKPDDFNDRTDRARLTYLQTALERIARSMNASDRKELRAFVDHLDLLTLPRSDSRAVRERRIHLQAVFLETIASAGRVPEGL